MTEKTLEFYSKQVSIGDLFETPNLFWCNGCKIQETWFVKCIVCDTIQCWMCIPVDGMCNVCYEFFPDKQK